MSFYTNEGDSTSIWDRIKPFLFDSVNTVAGMGPVGELASPLMGSKQSSAQTIMKALNNSPKPQSPLVEQPNLSQIANDPAIRTAVGISLPVSSQQLDAHPQSPLVASTQPQEQKTNPDIDYFKELLKNHQNDVYRSALLHAGAAMLSGNGNFGQQLGQGIEAGAKTLDAGEQTKLGGYEKISELGIKNNDVSKLASYMRAMTGQSSTENTEAQRKAAIALKVAQDPLADPEDRKQAQAIVNGYMNTTKVDVPAANIAKAALPQIGQVIGGYRFKGGNPRNKDSWESE